MKVLSLFDGISCGQIALNKAGIKYDKYHASEIDKNAIKVTQYNYPNTVQLGDVTKVKAVDLPQIDLLIGGSPCQGFSIAGKQLNFNDPRSKLFFEYTRLLEELKPKYFLLENVKMKKEFQDIITEYLKVQPIKICSSLVSAQRRPRIYWTNIPFKYPEDKKIYFRDILDTNTLNYKFYSNEQFLKIKQKTYVRRDYYEFEQPDKKVKCLMAQCGSNAPRYYLDDPVNGDKIRYLTRNEWERLQTVPDNYTMPISERSAKKALGNGWTVDVISHIFKGIT